MFGEKIVPALVIAVSVLVAGGTVSSAGFLDDRLWLKERSEWSETTGSGGGLRGWWGVGNSRVFGCIAGGNPITTIHQITGPHIQHPGGVMQNATAFRASSINVSVDGKPAAFTKQTLSKVRQTNVVVMDLVGDGIEVNVYNYSPFGVNALLRTVVIRNTGDKVLSNVVITSQMPRTVLKDNMLFDSVKGATGGNACGLTRQMFAGFIEPYEVSSNEQKAGDIMVKVGDIAPGDEAVRTKFMVFSMVETGDEGKTLELVKQQNTNLLKRTYDDWKTWFSTKTRLECPDQRLIDLLDDNKSLVKIQTAEPQYAAGPMEFFAGVWVRDSNGPFLYYLRMSDLKAARGMLEFYYRACAINKHISNFMPMDIDVSKPVDSNYDWTHIRNDPVEIPCWLIMQHKRYYDFTGDLEPIREHWGFLKKCLYGQLNDDKNEPFHTINYFSKEPGPNKLYRFPHHGDETWIYPGFEVLNSQVFPEPNDHPHWDAYSTDSTWEFVVSAESMRDFAKLLGEKEEANKLAVIAKHSRGALERDYWMHEKGFYAPALNMRSGDVHQPPFAMVNFNALWIDYLKPEHPNAISNVIETMKYTMNPNYVTDVTETLRVYVGMQPGMFLYNLAAIDHPYGEPALKAMVEIASPSGEYTEKHVTDPNSYQSEFRGHRIRPWEGGINMDAAYYYLTGLKPNMGNNRIALCPRMPSDWKEMSVKGQKLGDGTLDLKVTDDGKQRTYTIDWSGSKPLAASMKISLPQSNISLVKVNGKSLRVNQKDKWGLTTAKLNIQLAVGKSTSVTVDYKKEKAEQFAFERKQYEYIIPKNVPSHDVVLWDGDPRKRNSEDFKTFDYLKGKVNYRLISGYNPSSPAWLRPFLLRPDGKINTPVFLMNPNSVIGSLKYSKWWGDPELTKLFTDYMKAGGAIVMVKTGEKTSDLFGDLLGDSSYFTMATEAADVKPTECGAKVLELIGMPGQDEKGQEKKLTSNTVYIFDKMAVLGNHSLESAAGTILVKKYGKGFLMSLNVNLDFEQTATLGINLADPKKMSAIKELIATTKPESVPGAFSDFSKDNAYSDSFEKYKDGSAGLPVWLTLHGSWKMEKGEFHQMITNGYDFISTANAKIKGDYVVEVKMRLVENILEGGIVFNMPSRFSKGSGHMVRFCGDQDLWRGPFTPGGGFGYEPPFKSGLAERSKEWRTMKITVRNSKGTYDVEINGKMAGEGLKLTNIAPDSGCYVGLVACRGHVAFDDLKVTPLK